MTKQITFGFVSLIILLIIALLLIFSRYNSVVENNFKEAAKQGDEVVERLLASNDSLSLLTRQYEDEIAELKSKMDYVRAIKVKKEIRIDTVIARYDTTKNVEQKVKDCDTIIEIYKGLKKSYDELERLSNRYTNEIVANIQVANAQIDNYKKIVQVKDNEIGIYKKEAKKAKAKLIVGKIVGGAYAIATTYIIVKLVTNGVKN